MQQKFQSPEICHLPKDYVWEPVANPIAPEELELELEQLPLSRLVLNNRKFNVYLASALEIPKILLEIGRLREITFREIQEGTGKSRDLDRFDVHYLHLFLWDKMQHQLVGAYRLGLTDNILAEQGVFGLYTASLFRFHPLFFEKMGTAIELGRSFIRSEYQKQLEPLMLIWKGVFSFLAKNPRYRSFYGAVSVSQSYSMLSRELIVAFLQNEWNFSSLASLVQAKNPFPRPTLTDHFASAVKDLKEIQEFEKLLAEVETKHKTVPPLLKHYLKFNAKALAFMVDPDFGNCLDCLCLMNLAEANPRMLDYYMGKDASQRYLQTVPEKNSKSSDYSLML